MSIYFSEASADDIVAKLRSMTSGNEDKEKAECLRYLSAGVVWQKLWTITNDLLSNQGTPIGAPDILTDGVWAWSAEIIYYVGVYNLLLPSAFLDHGRGRNWVIPNISPQDLLSATTETVWPEISSDAVS